MIPKACASGNYSIGRGCDLIRGNRADLMIVGGVEKAVAQKIEVDLVGEPGVADRERNKG